MAGASSKDVNVAEAKDSKAVEGKRSSGGPDKHRRHENIVCVVDEGVRRTQPEVCKELHHDHIIEMNCVAAGINAATSEELGQLQWKIRHSLSGMEEWAAGTVESLMGDVTAIYLNAKVYDKNRQDNMTNFEKKLEGILLKISNVVDGLVEAVNQNAIALAKIQGQLGAQAAKRWSWFDRFWSGTGTVFKRFKWMTNLFATKK